MAKLLQLLPIVLGVLIFSAGSANACSCDWEWGSIDHLEQAANELEQADAVFLGDLIEFRQLELRACTPGQEPMEAYDPKGLVKVSRAERGVKVGQVVIVNFSGAYGPKFLNESCEVETEISTSCTGILEPDTLQTTERWWIGEFDENQELQLFDGPCGPSFYRVANEMFPADSSEFPKEP